MSNSSLIGKYFAVGFVKLEESYGVATLCDGKNCRKLSIVPELRAVLNIVRNKLRKQLLKWYLVQGK